MKYFRAAIPALVLLAIVLFCFARTLGSYFLADDFGHIGYVARIAAGDLGLLLSNFTGNFMQIPIINVYRPGLLMSLLMDFLLWRTNAFGYYLTNVLFMFGDGLLLYAVLRELTKFWGNDRSMMVSLLSAALFVGSPLHSESVSFIAGRSDVICCFFFLASLWCFVKLGNGKNLGLLISGVALFWVAVLTKEMAVTLPVLLAGVAFILPEVLGKEAPGGLMTASHLYTLKTRLGLATRFSLPLWISLIIYFVLRYQFLGTLTGGYLGSVGASQSANWMQKWTDWDTVGRILHPLNLEAFGPASQYYDVLTWFYVLLAALALANFSSKGLPWRWLLLIAVWLMTSLIPIYRLWGLGYDLEGARFLFFATIPLAMFWPVCLLGSDAGEDGDRSWRLLELISATSLAALVVVSTKIAYQNNIPWIHAGKETEACLRETQRLAEKIGEGKHAVLLGLPSERGGAHMILNSIIFNTMMAPPFSKTSYINRFVIFTPIFLGNLESINMQRFKQCLTSGDLAGVYVWQSSKLSFQELSVPDRAQLQGVAPNLAVSSPNGQLGVLPYTDERGFWKTQDGVISVEGSTKGSGFLVSPVKLNPFEYDYVQFDLSMPASPSPRRATVYWKNGKQANGEWCNALNPVQCLLPKFGGDAFQTVRIPLSSQWRWFSGGDVTGIRIELPSCPQLKIRNFQIMSSRMVAPVISLNGASVNNMGVYALNGSGVELSIDGNLVHDCSKIGLEISKPNYFFENMSDDSDASAILHSLSQEGNNIKVTLANSLFPEVAYYQIRAVCLNGQGAPVGEKSDPVTIYMGGTPM
jgi:hypothetical protein